VYGAGMARRQARGEVAYWETNNLDEHVALIARQVQRSLDDAETRKLAVRLVSGRPDGVVNGKPVINAWGKRYWMPQTAECATQSAECEIVIIWNFVVQNVRYVLDPDGYDLFSTLRHTLEAGGGDCDDMVICLAALLRSLGFLDVRARVVSTNGKAWEHVYLMVGASKSKSGGKLVCLDPTVTGATPGWEYSQSSNRVDYRL
jgi:hypothetical protein